MHPISQAIDISERIFDALNEEAWTQVDALEVERGKLIEKGFADHDTIDAGDVRRLKSLNDLIVERLQAVRVSILQQKSNLQKGGKASRAYLDTAAK